ncbi:MAG: acyl-CoA thioesterase [Thermoplasmataceae archaeon]
MGNEEEKSWKGSYTAIERLVLPPDTNIFNALYGGRLVEWIDNVASIVSFKHSRRRTVTGSMDSIFFLSQIRMGDIVTMKGRINYVGKTTMEIEVDVFSEESLTGEKKFATKAYLTYVAIDQNGKATAVPRLKLETEDDKKRFKEGEERSKTRNEKLSIVREEAKAYDV